MRTILIFIAFSGILISCNNWPSVDTVNNPVNEPASLPWLYTDNSGAVYMSWVEHIESAEDSVQLKYAMYEDGTWNEPAVISGSSSWFVNWADYPSIVSFRGTPVAAHWLRKIPGNPYSYVIDVSFHGREGWTDPVTPHFDSTATEHGFVSMIPWQENNVLAIWLDGRQTANRPHDEYYNLDRAMTLRSAEINVNGIVSHKSLIDDSVCDCCQTSLARTSYGAIAAYRNRTEDEIRDIYVSRYENGSWGNPFPVHADGWKIGACPVNGPKIAVNGSAVALAWFTRAGDKPIVKVSMSNDEGRKFSEPLVVSDGNPLGRVDAVVDENGIAHVSWMEQAGDSTYLNVKSIDSANPDAQHLITVAALSSSRASGFPQLTAYKGRLIAAWTETGEGRKIRTAIINPEL